MRGEEIARERGSKIPCVEVGVSGVQTQTRERRQNQEDLAVPAEISATYGSAVPAAPAVPAAVAVDPDPDPAPDPEPVFGQRRLPGDDQKQKMTGLRLRFRPRILVDVEKVSTTTTVLGRAVSLPVGLSPSAAHKLVNSAGEVGSAQAAQGAGTVMILSSFSTMTLEDVRAAASGCLLWQQTYIFRNRSLTESLVKRAAACGVTAIVVTVDSPVPGDGFVHDPYKAQLPHGLSFANLEAAYANEVHGCKLQGTYSSDMHVLPSATLNDIEWLCRLSKLPVVVKGVLTAEAALQAHCRGAAAVIVSNHGGRQLDGTPATVDVLPEIVAAVGDKMEVYLDGGVRTGADVVKALALGARAVFVGRPVLWGLAYDGKQGVDRVLHIFREELERTMRLLGCSDIRDLCEEFLISKNLSSRPCISTL
ncbi:L-lactate oxidase-like [Dermacentor variabilis]|uniref:L-lactate oxidase-like n=1 Tax=Dermacentor variabilis TaxID=34621 RepID=UPI003F5AE734